MTSTTMAVNEWLDSKKFNSKKQYTIRWQVWIEYCKAKGIPDNGDSQLEDMRKRRLNTDNSEKYFYDNEVPKFFIWLTTEYVGKRRKEHLSENSAAATTAAVRSFFSFHRYTLEIRKESIPSTDKLVQKYYDHAFDIYQLRAMFNQGDLKERTILACGKDLWLRVGDFVSIQRYFMELLVKREEELAENEKRNIDILEFELITEKEKEAASCHLSKESIELVKEYLRTYEQDWHSEKLFTLTEDSLNDLLKRLAEKSKITLTGRIRWHCLRKFGITLMHGKVTEPVMKYMTGKHIDKSLRVYIQGNKETWKAFKMIDPLISLTKTNGNSTLVKELEELKKERFKTIMMLKLMEKITPKDEMQKALNELAVELGLGKAEQKVFSQYDESKGVKLETIITALASAYEKKDLERVLKENGNGE